MLNFRKIMKMLKPSKSLQVSALVLLSLALLLAAINPNIITVKAQASATVDIISSVGGTTDPAAGTYTYADGTTVTLTANPGIAFNFTYWEIVTSAGGILDYNNPTTLTVNATVGTYVIQVVFVPLEAPLSQAQLTTTSDLSTAAIVVVLAAAGGTTTPAAGTYALANAGSFNLTAVADSGWVFDHWVISGTPMNHGAYSYTATPTNNPYNVNHGYGNTYTYQPVFSPVSSTSSTATPINEFSSAAAIIMVMILVIVSFGAYAYTKKAKK